MDCEQSFLDQLRMTQLVIMEFNILQVTRFERKHLFPAATWLSQIVPWGACAGHSQRLQLPTYCTWTDCLVDKPSEEGAALKSKTPRIFIWPSKLEWSLDLGCECYILAEACRVPGRVLSRADCDTKANHNRASWLSALGQGLLLPLKKGPKMDVSLWSRDYTLLCK